MAVEHTQYGAVPYQRMSKADLAEAQMPITQHEANRMEAASSVKRVDVYREANPFQCTRWHTAHGVVTGVWGFKFYRGECDGCGVLMTEHRAYPKNSRRLPTQTGRWA